MHPTIIFVLSIIALTAGTTPTTLPPGAAANTVSNPNPGALSQQQLVDLLALLSGPTPPAPSSPSTPSTNTNALPSLTDLMGAGGTSQQGGQGGLMNSVMRNPLMFALLRGDVSRQGLLLSTLSGNQLPGSPATQISLLREGLGEYLRYAGADVMMNAMSQASGMSPMVLPFMMREMFPENYLFNNLLFNNPAMAGGSGTAGSSSSGGMSSNSLLPMIFMRDMV